MDSCSDTSPQPEFERRMYQLELIEEIKKRNSILFLPTGSGKTFIALEIIKHMQKDLQKPVSQGGKQTIFLVRTVALVEQHYSFLKKHCSLNIDMLTGHSGVDLWRMEDWLNIQNNAQILIMTSQIYVNMLTHAYIFLKNANLIIFDECHHAVKKDPMRQVMTFFEQCDPHDHPKVLGLSATLLNANTTVLQFRDHLKKLENTFKSKIITSNRVAEVKRFSTKAKEKLLQLNSYKPPPEVVQQIEKLIKEHKDVLKNLKLKDTIETTESSDVLMNDRGENRVKLLNNCLSDLMFHLHQFGVYFCYIGCTSYIVQLNRIMFEKSNEELYSNALLMMINLLKAIRKILSLKIATSGDLNKIEVVMENSSHKLTYLIEQLKTLSSTDKCIVFVERRMTAKILSKIIEIFFEETKSTLVVDFMTGFNVHPLRNSREDDFVKRCSNKEVLSNFRSGKINVLVASNVLEEGIDMPDCNAVIMYDFPKTFRSYVQSKGRARKKESTYQLLLDKDVTECFKNMEEFRKIEKELENVVRSFDISHDCDDEKKSEKENEETYTTPAGATITKTEAIALIDLYCSSLPCDSFTQLTPYWWKNENEKGVYCKLLFPMNAAIRDIITGPVCTNIKEAKQAVAFDAVKMLHQMGVLNDNLMPILAQFQTQDEEYWFPNWDDIGEGTRSSKKEFDMKAPKYLVNCQPIPQKKCYLHVINIIPKYSKQIRRRELCYQLLTCSYELGIITRHRLPKMCDFPVFSDVGEVNINIDVNHRSLELNETELLFISKFHRVLFLKGIQVVKKCLVYSGENDSMGYLLVPLKRSCTDRPGMMEIAFTVIFDQWDICDVKEPSEEERRNQSFTTENYWLQVVIPWYHKLGSTNNESKKKRYYVITDVNENYDLTSAFPNKKYESFADFFEKKHNLKSLRTGQPMMEVRPIPLGLDCLRPRVTSADKSEKKRAKEQGIFMAPEFVMKQTFPSCYWYKSTVIPTILHRIHYILIAEEIREKIVIEGGIGKLEWEKDENDILEVNDKYTIKKNPSTQQQRELKYREKEKKHYISRNIDIDCTDDEFSIKRAPSSTISTRCVNEFKEPPSLMTLQEHTDYKGPRQKEIFEALTPAGCNDIVDLERLETLGDSFLKFAVSVTLFVKHSAVNEGYLTTLKGRIVGNRNLLYCGNKLNLGSVIKMNPFSANVNWVPPRFVLPEILKQMREIVAPSAIFRMKIPYEEQFSGNISLGTYSEMKRGVTEFIDTVTKPETQKQESTALCFYGKQTVSDKTIADVMEALIGVYVKTGGVKPAYNLLNYLGILANPKYEDIMGTPVPSPQLKKSRLTINDLIPNWKKLEQVLSYEFRDKSYIVQALSHLSYLKNNLTDCYQKLEFIGDAVLDFLITSYIYQYCGNLPPGKLTDLRASLVNNITFGALCVRLGLQKFLLSNNEKLTLAINRFIQYQEERNYEIHGNEMMILISEHDVKIAEEVEVPKILGDIFESIAGAIYLDSGNDLRAVWRTYYNIMKEEIEKFSKHIPINPIRALYEEPGLEVEFWDTELRKSIEGKVEVVLNVIKKNKTFIYHGKGENSHLGKRAAAKLALRDFGRTEFVI